MALSKNDFTVVVPILSALCFIILPVIGRLFLNEYITAERIAGTVLIALGMFIVAMSKK